MRFLKLFLFVSIFLILLPFFSNAQTESFPYDINSTTQLKWDNETVDLAQVIKTDSLTPSNSIMTRLRDFFRLSWTQYDKTGAKATDYIKRVLNILLGLISFIALILIIYAFYLIFFSKWEDGVAKAKKILIWVAIALVVMGLSRFIVSFFFNVFKKVT